MPTAIITGATQGIGKAIAEKLLSEGFDIAICARTEKDLEQVKSNWQSQYPNAKIFIQQADAGIESEIKKFAADAIKILGNVDILVNNAGIFMPGNICDEPEGQLEKILQVNVLSAYHLSRASIPIMKQQQSGHIFNICSVAGLKAYPGGGSYSISKYALLGLSENLRYELRNDGIKVTAISPGAVWSNSWSSSGVAEDRIMKAEDIAAILWASYTLSAQADVEHIVIRPQLGDL